MNETLKLALILFLIAAVSTGILAVVNNFTSVVIAEREAEELQNALAVVSPDADAFEPVDDATREGFVDSTPFIKNAYLAQAGGETIGYVFDVVAKGGYGGDIAFILGINADNEITGFQILSHGETPGFGAAAAEPEFAEGTIGATNADEINGISGATKTTNAIKGGISQAYDALGTL